MERYIFVHMMNVTVLAHVRANVCRGHYSDCRGELLVQTDIHWLL